MFMQTIVSFNFNILGREETKTMREVEIPMKKDCTAQKAES